MAEPGERLERFDDHKGQHFPDPNDGRLKADGTASVTEFASLVAICLKDYQSTWQFAFADFDRPTHVVLPYAWHLSEDSFLKNLTQSNKIHSVSSIPKPEENLVILDSAPAKDDVLVLDNKSLVEFTKSRPKEHVDALTWRDTISYSVTRREPATTGSQPFDRGRHLKPRLEAQYPDPLHPGTWIEQKVMLFENIVTFEVWSTTDDSVDELIEWFEDFLIKYTWVIKFNGVDEMLYWARPEREGGSPITDLRQRVLKYYVRTQRKYLSSTYTLQCVDIRLQLAPWTDYSKRFQAKYDFVSDLDYVLLPSGDTRIVDGLLQDTYPSGYLP